MVSKSNEMANLDLALYRREVSFLGCHIWVPFFTIEKRQKWQALVRITSMIGGHVEGW